MTSLTDGMYKTIFMTGIFFLLFGTFNSLFIGSQMSDETPKDLMGILSSSWSILSKYPELILIDSIFVITGLVVLIVVVRESLPV